MNHAHPRRTALLSALLLVACASDDAFPSLAPRSVEGIIDRPVRNAATPTRVADPALDAEVAALSVRVAAADRDWRAALPNARQAVDASQGRPVGSEPWVQGQQALARLDARRGSLRQTVEELDQLRLAQVQSPKPIDTTRLDALWSRAIALLSAQTAAYAEIASLIPVS